MNNNFNPIAWCYDTLSWIVFGNKLKLSQQVLLGHIQAGDKVLLLGGGTGWILHELLKVKKVSIVDYVEASEKMLQRTKERIPVEYHNIINFIHGEEDMILQQNYYDCIITCYFFDLFLEKRIRKVIALVVKSLNGEGRLLVADFYVSSASPLFHKLLMKSMYFFFRVVAKVEAHSLFPFRTLLKAQFVRNVCVASIMNGFIVSEVYSTKTNNH